ncbi:MAG TPA: ROK family protein [Candidatus Eisenbacteria bacterium]|nr:ROK family protein [Candidatus Eisenbacteria bacterium]
MKNAAIGVDIGGTSVKMGVVGPNGRIVCRSNFPTGRHAKKSDVLDSLYEHSRSLTAQAKKAGFRVTGVGIGAPGPIDVERGFVYSFPNIHGWENTPLRKILEKRLRLPVRIDNDANAMALGETLFGAGRGAKNTIALTLGTGVGGGIVIDGKLFHGPTYSAAEIGHIVLNEEGPQCGCGNRGCIETYVGNGYFVREVRSRLAAGEKSVLKRWIEEDGRELTPYLVWQAAKKGDGFAKKFWWETGLHLGNALVGLVNVFNPEKIILGGGVAQDKPHLLDSVTRTIKKKAFPIAARSVKVVPAALGVDAGLIGAAALVLAADPKRGRRA